MNSNTQAKEDYYLGWFKNYSRHNEELIFSVSALADEIWHEHFSSILSTEQIDYMLEKFLSPEALADQINHDYEYFLFSYEYTFAGFAGIHEENGSLFFKQALCT